MTFKAGGFTLVVVAATLVAALEIALTVAAIAPGFDRTITFAWWAEEEPGMHGSRHYVNTTEFASTEADVGGRDRRNQCRVLRQQPECEREPHRIGPHGAATGLWAIADRQTNPYSPEEICGRGFTVIDSHSFGADIGEIFLLYNPANGTNCVTTVKYSNIGTPSPVTAILQPEGGDQVRDSGSFLYYAGLVKAHAPGVCVRWGGLIDDRSWLSPYERCG